MSHSRALTALSVDEARRIRTLQLLIARAANRDSLAWWEDEALTQQGAYILERSMSIIPELAARRLALVAASVRHETAFEQTSGRIHLFRLDADNADQLAFRDISLIEVDVPAEPITSIDVLSRHLEDLLGEIKSYTVIAREGHRLRIGLTELPASVSPLMHRAETLACAYLEGKNGSPVFPYCLE